MATGLASRIYYVRSVFVAALLQGIAFVVGSYSQDANARGCKVDRACFSHADVVQSTVLEDHYCVTKSGLSTMTGHPCLSLRGFGPAATWLPPF